MSETEDSVTYKSLQHVVGYYLKQKQTTYIATAFQR